jgi:hypothetical protein
MVGSPEQAVTLQRAMGDGSTVRPVESAATIPDGAVALGRVSEVVGWRVDRPGVSVIDM